MAAVAKPRVLAEDDREEIRLALALNGGVSLAVWMGGVVHELDRLRRADGLYRELLDLTQSVARVDVVAGASAGGLNGALLASAIACNTGLEGVRDLWLDKGSFVDLVRDPFESDPPSLLRGDDYFLPTVRSAFEAVYARRRADPDPQPLDLIVTATTLRGERRTFADAFGSLIPDTDHRARFTFRRDPDAERDDFAPPEAPARLALAARSSSSFPAAFEASWVPVGTGSSDRPDMKGVASFTASRYAIDGGVLVNLPLNQVLRAILRKPARGQVRRVAAIIVPSPGPDEPLQPDEREQVPTILETAIASVSALPRRQSVGDYLEQIEEHNRRVLERRRRRDELLGALDVDRLRGLAAQLSPAYLRVRRQDVAQYVLRRIVAGASRGNGDALPSWNRDAVAVALGSVTNPPWLPSKPQLDAFVEGARADVGGEWPWGIAPVERVGATVLDLLRHGLLVLPLDRTEERAALRDLRERAHLGLRALRALRLNDRRVWEGAAPGALAAGGDAAELAAWVRATSERWRGEVLQSTLGALAESFATLLVSAAKLLRAAREGESRLDAVVGSLDTLAPDGATTAGVLVNLMALEIVERVLAPDEMAPEQPIEVVLVSGNAANAFDARSRASEKLAGLQLEHFGAFYKSSWRANDWLWGRLDGIARLVQVLLLPRRLRQLGYTAQAAASLVESVALAGADPSARHVLEEEWDAAAVAAELSYLDAPGALPPKSLPASVRAIVRRLQLEVLREEMPVLARCVLADVADGGAQTPARHWASRVREGEVLDAPKAVELFLGNQVGLERIEDEAGFDLFTRVATKALAAASTALRGRHSGLFGPLRTAATAVRGVAVATYLLARGAVARSKTGSAVLMGVLAVAGAVVAIPILTDANPWPSLTSLAVLVLIAGFLLALVRSGWLAVGLLVLAAAVWLALGAAEVIGDEGESFWERSFGWLRELGSVLGLVAIVLAAMALGVLRKPRWLGDLRRWQERRRAGTSA